MILWEICLYSEYFKLSLLKVELYSVSYPCVVVAKSKSDREIDLFDFVSGLWLNAWLYLRAVTACYSQIMKKEVLSPLQSWWWGVLTRSPSALSLCFPTARLICFLQCCRVFTVNPFVPQLSGDRKDKNNVPYCFDYAIAGMLRFWFFLETSNLAATKQTGYCLFCWTWKKEAECQKNPMLVIWKVLTSVAFYMCGSTNTLCSSHGQNTALVQSQHYLKNLKRSNLLWIVCIAT